MKIERETTISELSFEVRILARVLDLVAYDGDGNDRTDELMTLTKLFVWLTQSLDEELERMSSLQADLDFVNGVPRSVFGPARQPFVDCSKGGEIDGNQ